MFFEKHLIGNSYKNNYKNNIFTKNIIKHNLTFVKYLGPI